MERKRRTYYLDKRVIDSFDWAAQKAGLTPNQYLEKIGFMFGQLFGRIPLDAEPIGEQRGGDRTKKSNEEN